jgi:hypothetical protein
MSEPQHHICTECGSPFVAQKGAKTCDEKCRKRRSVRKAQQGANFTEFSVEAGPVQASMALAVEAGVADLPSIARDVLAEELRPVLREALTGRVLESIGTMVSDLLPLALSALRDDLEALRPASDSAGLLLHDDDGEFLMLPDYDRRQKAYQLVVKNTIAQPGLAPQPEAPDAAPIIVQFPEGMAMPSPPTVDGEAVEAPPQHELEPGQRQCDSCGLAKVEAEFVAGSERCWACHGKGEARVRAAIEARKAARPT